MRTRTFTLVGVIIAAVFMAMAIPPAHADAWNGGPKKVGDPVGVVVFDVYERNESGELIPLYMPTPDGGSKRADVMPAPKNSIVVAHLRAFTRDRRLEWWEGRLNGVPLAKKDALDAKYTMEARDDMGRPLWDTKKYGLMPYSQTGMDPYKVQIDTSGLAATTHMVEFLTRSTNGLAGFAQGEFQVSDMTIDDFRRAAQQYAEANQPKVTSQTTVRKSETKPSLPADAIDETGNQPAESDQKTEVAPAPAARPTVARVLAHHVTLYIKNGRRWDKVPYKLTTNLAMDDLLVFKRRGQTVATACIVPPPKLYADPNGIYIKMLTGIAKDAGNAEVYVKRGGWVQ
ncbi:MAG: hypothetical protein ABSE91_04185 [Patescibacteria group bacterium]